jgi:hypothetical protein
MAGEIFTIEALASNSLPSGALAAVVAYDMNLGEIRSTITVPLNESEPRTVRLVLPPSVDSGNLKYAFVVLLNEGQKWIPAAGPYFTKVPIANTITVTLQSNVPNMTLLFDSAAYTVIASETIRFETLPGVHRIEAQPVTYQSNTSRAVFNEWEDGSLNANREVTLSNDTTLIAFCRYQYFVNVKSPYGVSVGSGWYDENSTAAFYVRLTMISQESVIFAGWKGDTTSADARAEMFVNSPRVAQAAWLPYNRAATSGEDGSIVALLFSAISFAVLLAWNLRIGVGPSENPVLRKDIDS